MNQRFILAEIKNKNQKVFKKLFSDLYAELVVYANGYLFDKNASEDIVQEVFIYLWEQAESLQIRDSLKSYLYVMVRNKCLNYLKSIKIQDSLHLLDLNTVLISNHDLESFSQSDKQIIQNQLQKIITELPVKMQEIVRLRFISNYKYSEIAEEMGVSVNTVKTQLKRAKIKISASLSPLLFLFLQHFQ
ncbi:RNA polymerase sigma-70 factor, ECF subfamily [Zhouia amylolytica]|uniref:RNA polymerase ECF-type sigma factor n=2 Tax=Zhouia amylolytica TaxID=376730 RepID=W2ULE4_9FLAO|nr:RNA polymerase sigma-70 factor [Zhouia amylolytica]ETN94828.1 RNA polymerase ECF-type sigma factor [Zhouia amylolytica AD3]MCQ0111008.1 RNA polymerase sigma-70 factor [Zhouia amylolytica]SFS72239.1 RNA polymerase sigma-70 factor, ECF subfamily [Zhouia amylolytica]